MSDDAKRRADQKLAYIEAASRLQVALMEAEGQYQRALGRRVVQLVTQPGLVTGGTTFYPLTIALCADGTVWKLGVNHWHRLPPIPQDDVAPDAIDRELGR